MDGETAPERQILQVEGPDAVGFLQGLITNDMDRLRDGMIYAALLSPQGKYLTDFFVVPWKNATLIDVDAALAPQLLKRLNMYRLRADVQITPIGMPVSRGVGEMPDKAFPDPRHPALGWRHYGVAGADAQIDWDQIRVAHQIPKTNIELISDESYILELGFDRLNGVDFKKGCYVGQEVTARMKHKTELRKGLAQVDIGGSAPVGTEIMSDGKTAGTLYTQSGDKALAYLRFDRAKGPMTAAGATVRFTPKG